MRPIKIMSELHGRLQSFGLDLEWFPQSPCRRIVEERQGD
jgi:hypothetical protein